MTETYDIAVIGGGPAGLAAATETARAGATTLLLDDQPAPGGQIYRAVGRDDTERDRIIGPDYARGRALVRDAVAAGVAIASGTSAWWADRDGNLAATRNGHTTLIRAARLIVASGSMERPVPVPGWTLPGVMTAGAAQGLLKTGSVAARDAVFAGSGPLLYLVAVQYLRAGFPPRAVLDATPGGHYVSALRHLPAALRNAPLLAQGLGLVAALRRAGVPVIRGVTALRIDGTSAVEAVRYRRRRRWHTMPAAHVFLHLGVVPNSGLARALGCEHRWDDGQRCWRMVTDAWGGTSLPTVFLAGDGVAIGGAVAAAWQGRIAAWGALHALGRLSQERRDRLARPARAALRREFAARPFLDRLFRPPLPWRLPEDRDTTVCRCEGVTAGDIRRAVDHGARGLAGLKSFTRCGMGACQGRLCELTVADILADDAALPMSAIEPYTARFPIKPVAVGDLAVLASEGPE